MREIVAIFALVFVNACNQPDSIKKDFPYGVIGPNYGLLTRSDLEINAKGVDESERLKPNSSQYPYWQCFKTGDVDLFCDATPYDKSEHHVPALLIIQAVTPHAIHEYLARRVYSIEHCYLYKKDWELFTDGEPYVCISGLLNDRSERKVKGGHEFRSWTFDKFKTKKGCAAHISECALDGGRRNGGR